MTARVVFVCVHNAGRSQMAAALFNRLADPGRARAVSAGTHPAEAVHPEVLAVLGEMGIDLLGVKPTRLTTELAEGAAYLVTMGCGEACPFIAGARVEDWPVPDPKGTSIEEVRRIRDQVQARVLSLIAREGWLK